MRIFIFFVFLFLYLYLPAKAIFKILNLGGENDVFADSGLCLIFGLVFITIFGLFVRFLGFDFFLLHLVPIFSLLSLFPSSWGFYNLIFRKEEKDFFSVLAILFLKNKRKAIIFILILLVILSQSVVLFFGGEKRGEKRVFPVIHDTMWNIAIIGELANHFPPQHPGFAGEPLKNHHYFYPFFLAIIHRLTKMEILDIYFQLAPLLVSFLFASSLYTISTILSRKIVFRALIIFFGVFSGNAAYFLPLFLGKNFDWRGNTFFSDQPFDQIVNPYTVLGFALFLFGAYSLDNFLKRKEKLGWGVVSSFLIGSLYGFKSFGGIIAYTSLVFTLIFSFLKFPNKRRITLIFLLLCFSSFIFFLTFFSITDVKTARLVWVPGWLLTEMMNIDKLNLPQFQQIENFYRLSNNLLGLMKIKFYEFLIYFLGNLGVRILGIFGIFLLWRSPKTFSSLSEESLFYLSFAAFFSFFLPLFFNLGQNAYNIIQFTPYALVILAIFTVVFLENFANSVRLKKEWQIVLLLLAIIFAVPVNVKNFMSKLSFSGDYLSEEEFNALIYLREKTQKEEILLVKPEDLPFDGMYIPGLSQRRVYLASSNYAQQTGKNFREREEEIKKFFFQPEKNFLKNNRISYVYLFNSSSFLKEKKRLVDLGLMPFYENKKVTILEVKKE